jgi:uncharacterized SAM-binding protein YcdF (DUF218 family)
MKIRRKPLLWIGSLFLAAAGLALCIGWKFPQKLLCIDTGWAPADVIVVLGGDPTNRLQRAVELYEKGVASRILNTGAEAGRSSRTRLIALGVPPNRIELEPRAQTTWENAKFTVPLLRALGAKRVVIVTSWYHSRRGLHCFQKAAPEMTFYSCPSYHQPARSEWKREGLDHCVRFEYLKTAYYWVRYGVWPF